VQLHYSISKWEQTVCIYNFLYVIIKVGRGAFIGKKYTSSYIPPYYRQRYAHLF